MKGVLLMTISKLTMCKGDVEEAMARTFRRNLRELSFSHDYSIVKVSDLGSCVFKIQDEYVYARQRQYRYEATVTLDVDEQCCITSKPYCLSGCVDVESDEDDSPVVTFLGIISIRPC